MASWQSQHWESNLSGLPKRDRRSGAYASYVPDMLMDAPLQLAEKATDLVTEAEWSIRRLEGDLPDLARISRFLLRSEAIASSRIEQITPSARRVALTELEEDPGTQAEAQAQQVVNNMTTVAQAREVLATSTRIALDQLLELQRALLSDEPSTHGLRDQQNWIGGSSYHPLDAEFVPPAPELVPGLMDDLLAYLNSAVHSGVVQAALVHAQFETIHPFIDGNGRVGRALIHTVLTRRGLTPTAVLPISQVLSTLSDQYVAGLTAYRHEHEIGSPGFHDARSAWIEVFARAVITACEQAEQISGRIQRLREQWQDDLESKRTGKRKIRSDSAAASVLRDLPATPVLTVKATQRIYDISQPAAAKALEELVEADVLTVRKIKGKQYFQSPELLEILDLSSRQLASTRFDTRLSPPSGPAPRKG